MDGYVCWSLYEFHVRFTALMMLIFLRENVIIIYYFNSIMIYKTEHKRICLLPYWG